MKENPNFKVDPNLSQKTYGHYDAPPSMNSSMPKVKEQNNLNNNIEKALQKAKEEALRDAQRGCGLGHTTDLAMVGE